MNRRDFNKAAAAAAVAAAFSPLNVRAQAQKLKVGVLLPRSGVQGADRPVLPDGRRHRAGRASRRCSASTSSS